MKDIIFNIVVLAIIILAVVNKSCNRGIARQNQNMYGTEQVLNQRQLDSAFVADTLDPNLENWLNATFVDYETNEKIVKYLYIKENTDIRYTITPQDTLFLYNKIEVKNEIEVDSFFASIIGIKTYQIKIDVIGYRDNNKIIFE